MLNTPEAPRAPIEFRRWTTDEERRLLRLHEHEHKPWTDIAIELDRTPAACQHHYYGLVQEREAAYIDWTAELDHHIIELKRRGLNASAIAAELSSHGSAETPSTAAIEYRWLILKKKKKVPHDVLATWSRKAEVVWSTQEDDCIVALWVKGYADEQIATTAKFAGKSHEDVKRRRIELIKSDNPRYAQILGRKEGGSALERALGVRKKYDWMK
jgi:hypothetical protein